VNKWPFFFCQICGFLLIAGVEHIRNQKEAMNAYVMQERMERNEAEG